MTRLVFAVALCLLPVSVVRAQRGPMAGAPRETLEGRIVKVRIAAGEGMPSVVVKTGEEEREIVLGPLRFLMARNFNPKVGDEVTVKAYKVWHGWVAAEVTMKRTGQKLQLREESGIPVWRGGRW